jgi:tyrosyl-tRNA synthetase
MYPLMQAYDSVALRADVELGGSDQKFNLLVARTVQERYDQPPQVCLIMPLLPGTDGEQKMSKSYDNYIGITEAPEQQFGKTMSIPDALLEEWLTLAVPAEPDDLAAAIDMSRVDPYSAKRDLGRRIVRLYHGDDAVAAAEAHFDRLFREHAAPDHVDVVDVSLDDDAIRYDAQRGAWLPGLLAAAGLAASNSEAIRLIQQGAVSVDGERIADRNANVAAAAGEGPLLQRGKRHFVRVRFTD